jgi:hypothetical protein
VVAVDQLNLDTRLLPQLGRHTGGVLARAGSNRTLPNRYMLHG